MKQKNRFGNLLEHLMEVAELKNSTLANELQYDVSYISKWVSGRMLPSVKSETDVLRKISQCVVRKGNTEGRETLMADYQVVSAEELEEAIFDNLVAEYDYVKNTERDTGNIIAPKTLFFPKLTMSQYISRMRHPVLRRVKSLDIMALMDLMAMEREYRSEISYIENGPALGRYMNVHFSMIIDLETIQKNYVYDVVFLLNMLTNMTCVDFHLYGAKQAYGRAMFTVKDEFAISGMLMQSRECISVVVSEDPEESGVLYRSIRSLCTRERLLVRNITMQEMLEGNDYARSLISPNQRLLFGHMTEHFLPDALFETILDRLREKENSTTITVEQLRWFHTLAKRRFEELPIRILFYESALAEFAVVGELDFYNMKIKLTPSQRLQYVTYMRDLIQDSSNLEVRLIYGRLFSDFQYNANQCVYLTDGISYLSLDDNSEQNSLCTINHADMKKAFESFYEEIWEDRKDVVVSGRVAVLSYIDHIIQQVRMIDHLEE